MTDVCVKIHPELGVLVGTDGHVMVPGDKFHKPHWTRGSRMKSGYFSVCVQGHRNLLVHRLVLETFVGPCPDGMECDHRNRDGLDNRVDNLSWVTHSENNRNKSSNDSCVKTYGVHSYENRRAYKTAWARESRKGFSSLRFADGTRRLVPLSEVEKYRGIPVKERIYEVA